MARLVQQLQELLNLAVRRGWTGLLTECHGVSVADDCDSGDDAPDVVSVTGVHLARQARVQRPAGLVQSHEGDGDPAPLEPVDHGVEGRNG